MPPSETNGRASPLMPSRLFGVAFSPRFNISSMCPVVLCIEHSPSHALRRKKPGRGRCRIRFRPRNLLRIYLVPFCVGYSTRSPSWNQMLLSRVCFSIHLWRLLFDPLVDCVCGLRFFLDRSWTGNANEQPISPPADGRHVPLGRGRCKHYRNIGRSCAVTIGSRFHEGSR